MKLEINKIVVLGNDEEYLVIDSVNKDNKDYYYIAEVNAEESDIKDNYKIVTINSDNENSYVEEVTGEAKLKEILPLFAEKMKE